MAKTELNILVRLRDDASNQLKQLNTELGTNKRQWQENFGAIISEARQASMAIGAFGAAVSAALYSAVSSFIELERSLYQVAIRTGIAIDTLRELRYAAMEVGVDLNTASNAINYLQRAIYMAQSGMATYIRAFRDLGISYHQLSRMTPEQQFNLVGQALMNITNLTDRAGIANYLFGQRGAEVLAMFERMQGPAGDLGRAFANLTRSMDDLKAVITSALSPAIVEAMGHIANIINAVSQWARQNPELASGIILIVGGVGALAVVLGALGVAATFVLPMLATGFAALLTPIGAIIAAITALGLALAALSIRPGGIFGTRWAWEAAPSMQYGGIIPGPIGQPVPVIAHGGERFLGAHGGGEAGNINITLNVAGSIRSDTDIASLIRREILWIKDRNYTAGLT